MSEVADEQNRPVGGVWQSEKTRHCEELEATKQSLVSLKLLRYARNDVSSEFQPPLGVKQLPLEAMVLRQPSLPLEFGNLG